MTVKMPYWDGKFNCELFDMKGVCIFKQNGENNKGTPMELLPKGSHVKGLVQCKGLWFVGGKFGVTWQLLQACVKPPQRVLGQGVCRMMADSDDDEVEEALEAEEADEADERRHDVRPRPPCGTRRPPNVHSLWCPGHGGTGEEEERLYPDCGLGTGSQLGRRRQCAELLEDH